MKRKKMPMADWFDPILLLRTGIRVAVSTVFGQMADRREAMAAANAIAAQPKDPSFIYTAEAETGEFWFDFMADTGDGWDPTFAMAQLLTEPALTPKDADRALPRGRVLMIGGDLVYPTASPEAYDDRFLHPFETAYENAAAEAKAAMPDLYAIPGNHDWYDGLGSFFNLICRRRIAAEGTAGVDRPGRKIAGRRTLQTRSYFAIELPGGWWLWGTDSQLKGYVDQPQIDFFQYVASNWMPKQSKVILCVGMPNWAYVERERPEKEFQTFSYLERLAGIARVPLTPDEKEAGKQIEDQPFMGHQLKLVLTGDCHHYSRYIEPRDGAEPVHYITCGGGGAFLHATHQLKDKSFKWHYPPPGVDGPYKERGYPRRFKIADKEGRKGEALFPDRVTSRALAKGNIGFAFRNLKMTGLFLVAYLLFNWLLNLNARVDGHASLLHALGAGPIWEAPLRYVWISFVSPWPAILFFAAMGAYRYFADAPHDPFKRLKIGAAHGLIQAATATLITATLLWLIGRYLLGMGSVAGIWATAKIGLAILGATTVAAFVSATIFGLYLLISLNRWGRHWNEAFSSLAIPHYKCFLRMRIGPDGKLEVYPVGLDTVPKGGGSVRPKARNRLKPHLIEGPVQIG
jgi:3',5'-cyclic AMP phosphodiesterase CpdA